MKKLLTISCWLFLTAGAAFGQNVPYSDITLSSSGLPVGGAPIAVCGNPGLSTTAATVTANIAILTMSSNPITAGYVANQAIAVSGFTGADTYFNGGTVTSTGISNNFLILSVTSTQITYALTHANASATSNGSVFQSGSQGQACAPLSSIFNDAAGASPIAQPGLTSSGLGNYQFYGAGGTSYYVQFYGATIGEILKPVVLPCGASATCNLSGAVTINSPGSLTVNGPATLGNGNSFAPVTFSNHNNSFWAGPGATPTVDQAVAQAASLSIPAYVEISAGYTGPESANCFATSVGYSIYNGPNNVTVIDRRAIDGNNAVAGPNCFYRQMFGGRNAGAISGLNVNYICNSPPDSCAGGNTFNWFGSMGGAASAFPSTNGLIVGNINLLFMHDAIAPGTSTSEVASEDSELHADATSSTNSNPIYHASAHTGGVLFSRTGAAVDVIEANWAQGKTCSPGGATAIFYYCYGYHGYPQTGGTYRNFASALDGDELFGNGVKIWASSADTTVGVTATETNQTATFTMASNCAANPTFVAGALVGVTGMSVAGYNTQMTISKAGCTGSSWSAFLPGTNGLAAGSGGTAQTTTPQTTTQFGSDNIIHYRPLSNTLGWQWETQSGTVIFKVNSTGIGANQTLFSVTAGSAGLGIASNPFADLVIGTAATNNFFFNPAATAAARTVSIPDPGTNVNLAFNLTATSSAFATATTAGTCVQNTTAVAGAATTMVAEASPVSTPGVGAVWSAFVSSSGNVTINECAVATSAGGTIAFNIRVHP